jgi:predicted PurR-regulated permease PerM
MVRLTLMLFSMVATVLMGIGVVVVLSIGLDTARPIMLAALAGFVLAVPVSWFVTRQIRSLKGGASLG